MNVHALSAILFAAALPAHAQLYSCSTTASAVAFGAYSPFSPVALDSAGEVRVSCSLLGVLGLLVGYEISLSSGSSGTFSGRQMSDAGRRLDYNLYTDFSRTRVWGDGSSGSSTVSDGYPLGLIDTTRSYSIYGRVPAAQNLPVGTYADTIVVTVEY